MRVIKKRNEMKWKKTRWWHWPGSLIQSAHTNLLLYNNNASERGPCRAAQQMSNGQRQRGFGLLHKSVRELQTSRKRIKSCSFILVSSNTFAYIGPTLIVILLDEHLIKMQFFVLSEARIGNLMIQSVCTIHLSRDGAIYDGNNSTDERASYCCCILNVHQWCKPINDYAPKKQEGRSETLM